MLAVLSRLHRNLFEFLALVPGNGPLTVALHKLGVETVEFSLRDDQGQRQSRDALVQNLREIAGRIAPAILHANSLSMGRLTGALGRGLAYRRVAHMRDIIRVSRATVRDLNKNSRLIAVSQATADAHIRQGIDTGRVTVLHNGVDCDRFAPRPKNGDLTAELTSEQTGDTPGFVALSVGQIGLRKGLDTLAEAAVILGRRAGIDFVLVGERYSQKAESVEFDAGINRTFERAGLQDNLHRLGYRDDIARLMNEADILIHAAKQEPFGRVLLEAAASGLPIVATDVGGTREMLDETAVLVPPNDPLALANAIDELKRDASRRKLLACAARKRIVERFAIEGVAQKLAETWQAVLH